jgi:hypothetical protein
VNGGGGITGLAAKLKKSMGAVRVREEEKIFKK